MRRIAAILIALGFSFVPGMALAHEGGHDARGVVIAVIADQLTVKTSHGEESFALTPRTEFVKGGKPASVQDVKPSGRVVVHAKKQNGRLEAIKVQVARPQR